MIQHIPISLLELNTFGHAVCAILIYFLWWEKPFEVDYPTMIESKQLWEFHALNFMGTNSTAVTQKFNRDVRARMKGNERWWALSKVKMFCRHLESHDSCNVLCYLGQTKTGLRIAIAYVLYSPNPFKDTAIPYTFNTDTSILVWKISCV